MTEGCGLTFEVPPSDVAAVYDLGCFSIRIANRTLNFHLYVQKYARHFEKLQFKSLPMAHTLREEIFAGINISRIFFSDISRELIFANLALLKISRELIVAN